MKRAVIARTARRKINSACRNTRSTSAAPPLGGHGATPLFEVT